MKNIKLTGSASGAENTKSADGRPLSYEGMKNIKLTGSVSGAEYKKSADGRPLSYEGMKISARKNEH